MPLEKHLVPRWVVQKVDEYTVRCAKELAIRHNIRIAQVVEIAVYQLYANPQRLQSLDARREPSAAARAAADKVSRAGAVASQDGR